MLRRVCPHCQGTGNKAQFQEPTDIDDPLYRWIPCEYCKGTGFLDITLVNDVLAVHVRESEDSQQASQDAAQ